MIWRLLEGVNSGSRVGALMALASMSSVQIGLAASVQLSHQIGAEATAWLRLAWAGAIVLLVVRPRRSAFTRRTFLICVALGVVTGAVTMFFMAAITRLPLGTASALEFLGPLTVAIIRSPNKWRPWPIFAAVGVVLLTEPWRGSIDLIGVGFALASAVCWAAYILLTQLAGDEVSGVTALGVSMPVAAIVSTIAVGPWALGQLTWQITLLGIGLAILLPVIPFTLEFLALRRLNTAAFGTLMSLEPAIALVVGLIVLLQIPSATAIAGIALVVIAGIGAERTGARTEQPVPDKSVVSG